MPVVGLRVRELTHGRMKEYSAPMDTGFAGYLMLPEQEYDELSTNEVPREQYGEYRTLAGPVVTRRSRVMVDTGSAELESFIETPLYGGGKLLVGRRIINQLDVALLGPQGRACLVAVEKER
jgi:predicted aspartyl protease